MKTWVDRTEYERIDIDESETVRIEGDFDSFERIDIRDSDESEANIHVFKIEKETDIFEISMHWAVDPEDEDLSEDELKELSVS